MDALITAIQSLVNGLASLIPTWDAVGQAIHDQTTATTNIHKPKLKPEPPSTYDGNQQRVNAFIAELQLYFMTLKIEDEAQKISYALSKVKGGKNDIATRWADQQRIAILHGEKQNPVIDHFADYQAFETAFIAYFAIRDTSGEAIEAIRLLVQGDHSADEYLTMFKSYADNSGYNEPALLEEWKRGINNQLRTKVANTWPSPKTLAEWQTRCCEIDRAWRIDQRSSPRKNPNSDNRNPRGSPQRFNPRPPYADRQSQTPPTRDPMAMDVDRTKPRGNYAKTDTCFTCGKKGHFARDCPDKAARIRSIVGELSKEDREILLKEAGF